MLSATEVIEKDFLEHRHMLIEIAAYLDRHDAAVIREGEPATSSAKLEMLDQALALLREPPSKQGRAHDLLVLFGQ